MEKERKVVSFDNFGKEKEELKKVKRSIKPNTPDTQKYPKNSKLKFNEITRKMDDLTPDIIDDKLKSMEEVDESKINEGAPNFELQDKIIKTQAYHRLSSKFKGAIEEFERELDNELDFDEGDTDNTNAINLAIQSAADNNYGW